MSRVTSRRPITRRHTVMNSYRTLHAWVANLPAHSFFSAPVQLVRSSTRKHKTGRRNVYEATNLLLS